MDDDAVFEEGMKLGIALTIGGNPLAQSKFHEAFNRGLEQDSSFRTNSKGLKMLKKIYSYIEKSFSKIRMIYEQKNEVLLKMMHMDDGLEKTKYENSLDDYDKRAASSIKTAKRVFRFLQLLCEGHNQTMQNFLRQQFEESDPLYSLNIDFIKYTAQIFGAFVKYMNPALMGLAE